MLRLKGSHASKNCHDISAWILNLTTADHMRVILSGSVHQWDTTLEARGQDIFFPAKEASKSTRGGLGNLKCLLFVFLFITIFGIQHIGKP